MNNLLFTVLIIALLYYFFYYLPKQKQLTNPNPILTHSQFTQTDPALMEKKLQQKESTIIGLNNSYEKLETKKNQEIDDLKQQLRAKQSQITNLQSEIRDLAKRPLKPTNSKGTQTDELTTTLDNLIKEVQDLNNSL